METFFKKNYDFVLLIVQIHPNYLCEHLENIVESF